MSAANSTTPPLRGKPVKPPKPHPDYPLTAHPAGYWCKKIRGKLHYFGRWDDPDAALALYLSQKDDLHAGRTPRVEAEALTVKAMVNAFLTHKQGLRDTGERSPRTFQEHKTTCDILVAAFGKQRLVADLHPDDFVRLRAKLAKRYGPVRLYNTIQNVRSVFKHAKANIDFGQGFEKPSKKVLRVHRSKQGPKLFTADEIRRMLDAAGQPLKAMLLLGINCGFGMADCGRLPLTAMDLDGGWIDYAREKTGIARRCPLWPETVASIREWLAMRRPEAKDPDAAALAFLTAKGRSWHKENMSGPACFKVGQLLKKLGINSRKGLGFYTLRHTFRTVADETRDQRACDSIMGHVDNSMAGLYRESIGDERLRDVAEHVRAWLWAETKEVQ